VDKLYSLKLYDFPIDEDNWATLKAVWRNQLCRDERWHFFWEFGDAVIRCQDPHAVLDQLRDMDIDVELNGDWREKYDTRETVVNKYAAEFEQLFHTYSELAMKLDPDDFLRVLERIIHCFWNPSEAVFSQVDIELPDWMHVYGHNWEGVVLSLIAASRSAFSGRLMYDKEFVKNWRESV